tara:strand:- start:542 stop:943 length:402 start_codon:yes stop_codon:yes gene_type:complete
MWMERTLGDLEKVIELLHERVPMTGPCDKRYTKNKRLDRFRRASNVVHDIFNNGLMNRGKEIRVLDSNLRVCDLPIHASNADKWDIIEDRISHYYREIVMDAVLEQFGREGYLNVCHNRSSQIISKAIAEGRV